MTTNRMLIGNDTGSAVAPAGDPKQAALDAMIWPIIGAGLVGTGIVSDGMVTQHGSGGLQVVCELAVESVLGAAVTAPGDPALAIGANASSPPRPRFDLVVDRAGVSIVIPGAVAADGQEPCWPAPQFNAAGELTDVVRAAVFVRPGATDILTEDITLLGIAPAQSSASGGAPPIMLELFRRDDASFANSYMGCLGAQVAAYNQSNVTEDPVTGDEYSAFYTALGHPVIEQRLAGELNWTQFDLHAGATGTALGSPVSLDNLDHYVISFEVDNDGYIHLCANMHAGPLQYVRSTNPRDITAWTVPGGGTGVMTGTDENLVTYPAFVGLPNGDLLFFYRNGGSGNGDTFVNRKPLGSNSWGNHTKLYDGVTDNLSIYTHQWCVDDDGNVHSWFSFRDAGLDSEFGMYYVRLTGGQTGAFAAEMWDATAVTLPIRRSLVGHVAERPVTIAASSGLSSAGGACIDRGGYPHVVYYRYDANGFTQFWHAYRDATGWHEEVITDFHETIDTSIAGPFGPRPAICATPSGSIYIVGPWYTEGLGGAVWAWDATPGATDRRPFPLIEIADQWETTFSYRAHARGYLQFLVLCGSRFYSDAGEQRLTTSSGLQNGEKIVPANNFATDNSLDAPAALAARCTVDLSQMATLAARAVRVPTIRVESADSGGGLHDVSTATVPAATTPQRTALFVTGGDSAKVPTILHGDIYRGRPLFARLIIHQTVTGLGEWIASAIQVGLIQSIAYTGVRSAASDPGRCCALFALTGEDDVKTTAWALLPEFNDLDGSLGTLILNSWVSGAGANGTIAAVMIQLGVLDGEIR